MRSWLKDSRVRTMLPTEAAWLAGFFDGEGSLCTYRGGRGGAYRSWILSITNTHLQSLEYCRSITGAGVVKPKRRNNAPAHWKPGYQWQVNAQREIVSILRQLADFLIIKKGPVDEFLANWRDVE